MNFLEKHRYLIWLFAGLTVLMVIAAQLFYVNDIIAHPQFGPEFFGEKVRRIWAFSEENPVILYYYFIFFFLDTLWAPLGLFLIYQWAKRLVVDEGFWKTFKWSLIISSSLAFGLDIFENVLYVLWQPRLTSFLTLKLIISLKTLLYGLVLLHLIVALYQEYLIPKRIRRQISNFIKASFLSLLIVFTLGALLTYMEQGATVVVDLFSDPVNILATFFFLNVLAMACSHYPNYISTYLADDKNLEWNLKPMFSLFRWLGMGLVTYTIQSHGEPDDEKAGYRQTENIELIDHLRKNLGTLFLFTWVFVLLYLLQLYVWPDMPVGLFCVLLVIGIAFLYRKALAVKKTWQRTFKKDETTFIQLADTRQDEKEHLKTQRSTEKSMRVKFPAAVKNVLHITLGGFVLLVIGIGITMVFSQMYGWSFTTWTVLLATSLINIGVFVLFRSFRTVFSYYPPPRWLRWTGLHLLSNDIRYVSMFAALGYLSVIIIIYAHSYPARINGLVLILAYLYLFYGVIIIPIKHFFFYRKNPGPPFYFVRRFTRPLFKYYLVFIVLIIAGYSIYMGQAGNTLHQLAEVPEKESTLVTWSEHKDTLRTQLQNTHKPMYLLASYGGGLRANLWTQLLLDHLRKTTKDSIFQTMAGMSGVSGGFLGISFYTALRTENPDTSYHQPAIQDLGKHNFLSVDLVYLLGWDLFRELWPRAEKPFCIPDRAGQSMQAYAQKIQPDRSSNALLEQPGFRNYWSKTFRTLGYWPALIGNTTGVHGQYGVVFSVKTPDFDRIFPGANEILEIPDTAGLTLPYLDATSTTNRFPVFSPTAKIENKGHFLDGGYFENSGLLSLVNYYDYLCQNDSTLEALSRANGVKLIQFINSRNAYLKQVAGDYFEDNRKKATGELSAIINTVTSIDILPAALEAKYGQSFSDSSFIQVYLPYPLSYEEVINAMGGLPNKPFELLEKIEASNQKIHRTLSIYYRDHWGKVPPPLARVLGEPAMRYTNAMLHHPEVQDALNKLK